MGNYPNKKFIEAVDNRYESKYNNRAFKVIYEDYPKPESGIWMSVHHSFGCRHNVTIKLDDEDINYLYNKYKNKAVEEIELEEQDKKQQRLKEIAEAEEKLRKLKEDE